MRMKKFLILAATVALSAACSQTFEVNPVSKDGGKIGFGTWAEGLTRAEARVQGTNTFLAGDTFAVYGTKDRASGDPTSSVVFDDVVVTASGSPVDTWSYDVPRFWDVNYDSYTFYAVSPSAVGTAATVTPSTGVIASAAIAFAGNDNDVLVADKKVVAKGSAPYFSDYATVPMVFNHIASLFSLTVRKHTNLDDATVAITGIAIDSLKCKGTFNVSAAYTDNHPVVTWTPANAADSVADFATANTKGVVSKTLPTDVTSAATGDTLISQFIAMPQVFNTTDTKKQTIRISYTIKVGDEEAVAHVDVPVLLREFDDTANDDDNVDANYITAWEPGKHYIYNIIIDAKQITFTASITDWTTTVNGYHYLMD